MLPAKAREARTAVYAVLAEIGRKEKLIGRARDMIKRLGWRRGKEEAGEDCCRSYCRECDIEWRATGSLHKPDCKIGQLLHDLRMKAR